MVYSWGSSLNGKLGRVDASENDLDAVLNPYRSPALLEWKEANPPHIVTGDAGGDFTVLVDGTKLVTLFSQSKTKEIFGLLELTQMVN